MESNGLIAVSCCGYFVILYSEAQEAPARGVRRIAKASMTRQYSETQIVL